MTDTQTRRDVLRGLAVGGVGIALAGCAGSSGSGSGGGTTDAGGDDGTTAGGSDSGSDAGGSSGSGGDADLTIEVGPGGEFKYTPESPTVSKGATVKWVWKSDMHNIVIEKKPSGSDWSGTKGGSSETFDEGYTYTHTFETTGTYEYYCSPHESVGMAASITVE
ncbi:plastocyanin [Halogranum gelatinilyticum]|uniref:Plastocyanin n=1 Tax=Halogranum gelatinilyticum TaxID=660521 RepID=A0A1G9YN40_9EURY|nr:plastocyanin/azurin family copper-binding protein [Halogranum gelatinilyticum]SDN10437.1 plastocyanin [Halogranum gelatinilyticum]